MSVIGDIHINIINHSAVLKVAIRKSGKGTWHIYSETLIEVLHHHLKEGLAWGRYYLSNSGILTDHNRRAVCVVCPNRI